MTEKNEKLNLETIIQMVKENPNDFDLGQMVRRYVRSNNINVRYVDPNQLSLDLGDQGQYEDVEDDDGIDIGEASNNLNIG